MSYQFDGHIQQGWQCPVCGAVYSPFMMACTKCTGYKVSNITTEEYNRLMKLLSQGEWKTVDESQDGLKHYADGSTEP